MSTEDSGSEGVYSALGPLLVLIGISLAMLVGGVVFCINLCVQDSRGNRKPRRRVQRSVATSPPPSPLAISAAAIAMKANTPSIQKPKPVATATTTPRSPAQVLSTPIDRPKDPLRTPEDEFSLAAAPPAYTPFSGMQQTFRSDHELQILTPSEGSVLTESLYAETTGEVDSIIDSYFNFGDEENQLPRPGDLD